MNYFAFPTAADRYAKGRPFFHPLAIERIRSVCCKNGRIDRALDVGCGTGRSALALLEAAGEIVGLDNSSEMLSHAARNARIHYVEGWAEQMPFDDASFGLMTVALAFHWLQQEKFMAEARRVLRPGGWLVIYNDWFTGHMNFNERYEVWNRDTYLVRYPSPARRNQTLTDSDASACGFSALTAEEFVHEVEFSPDQLAGYLLTQTNVIAAIKTGRESWQSAEDWILDSVQPLFSKAVETFPFSCQIRFFQRH